MSLEPVTAVLSVSGLRERLEVFATPLIEELENQGILSHICQVDHACLRVESEAQYREVNSSFARLSRLLIESEINGRKISTYKFADPLIRMGTFLIDVIEVPAPKAGSKYSFGIEHIECVTRESLGQFMAKFPDLVFDRSNLNAARNADVSCRFLGRLVKFHTRSLEDIIAEELKTD